jgi:hypothetical protein
MQDIKRRTNLLAYLAQGFCWLVAAGCDQSAELSSPTAERLRTLTYAYLDYAVAKGAGPANEQQLRAHLRNVPAFVLEAGGVSPEAGPSAFVSERDRQPFVFHYGLGVSCGPEADVIACEQRGKGGVRLVAYTNGKVDCVDDVAAKELMHFDSRSVAAERPRASHASVFGNFQHARR